MSNVKTINITGTETEVNFDQKFKYFWVLNLGSKTIYASWKSGIVPKVDGVCTVTAGGSARVSAPNLALIRKLYLSGSGNVHIMGTYSAHYPFKTPAGGAIQTDEKPFITNGIAALFDASSLNLEDNKWVNKFNTKLYAAFNSPSSIVINNNAVRIPANTFGTYFTEDLKTIYVLFKMVNSNLNGMLIGRDVTSRNMYNKFDIGYYSTAQIYLSYHDIDTGVKASDNFVLVCVTKNPDNTLDVYINGVLNTHDTYGISNDNYNGNFTINASTDNRSQIWDSTDVEYKAILLDTETHSSEDIQTNSLKMLEIYNS